MEFPSFVNADKTLSKDGARLVEWLDAQCSYAESLPLAESVNHMNTVSGPIRQYYINVYKLKSHTSAAWVEDFKSSWTRDCYAIMTQLEEKVAQAQTVSETASKADKVEGELAKLSETLTARFEALEAENKALRAEVDAQKKKPGKKDEAKDADETEA